MIKSKNSIAPITAERINNHQYVLSTPERMDIAELARRVNNVQARWLADHILAQGFTITSGFRAISDQLSIYEQKARAAGIPFDKDTVPLGSQHLHGRAVDIYDPDLLITAWLKANEDILVDQQLWCEEGNKNWVHFQSIAPKSGKRWFLL